MKKEMSKKILLITLCSLLLFSFLAGVVSAEDTIKKTTTTTTTTTTEEIPAKLAGKLGEIFDPVADMFAEWGAGDTSKNVAKYALIILLTLLIYSITSVLPFIGDKSDWIKWPFALIVAFLAGAYITPEEVYVILVSYGAMGIVLGTIIPFVILMFFNIELVKKSPEHGKMIADVVWIGFIIFLVYKLIVGWAGGLFGPFDAIVYFIFIGASLVWIFWGHKIIDIMFVSHLKTMSQERKKNMQQDLELEISRLTKYLSTTEMSKEEARRLDSQLKRLERNRKMLNAISWKE